LEQFSKHHTTILGRAANFPAPLQRKRAVFFKVLLKACDCLIAFGNIFFLFGNIRNSLWFFKPIALGFKLIELWF
jgi:hypothetical protein